MPYPILKQNIIKSKKRVARGAGSGRGGTSGRGHKGQNARTGNSKKPHFESGAIPLYRRLPKIGGFYRHWVDKSAIVNLKDLKHFTEKDIVNLTNLKIKNIISGSAKEFKILSVGEIDKPLTLAANYYSAAAKTKLEKAGCKLIAPEEFKKETKSTRKLAKKPVEKTTNSNKK